MWEGARKSQKFFRTLFSTFPLLHIQFTSSGNPSGHQVFFRTNTFFLYVRRRLNTSHHGNIFLNLNYHCELMSILSKGMMIDFFGPYGRDGTEWWWWGAEVWSGSSICILPDGWFWNLVCDGRNTEYGRPVQCTKTDRYMPRIIHTGLSLSLCLALSFLLKPPANSVLLVFPFLYLFFPLLLGSFIFWLHHSPLIS